MLYPFNDGSPQDEKDEEGGFEGDDITLELSDVLLMGKELPPAGGPNLTRASPGEVYRAR